MAGMDGMFPAFAAAIKEMLKEDFQEIRDHITKQGEKGEELAKKCEDLSGKMEEREREAKEAKESLDKCREDLEGSNSRLQAQVTEEVTAIKARLDKFEDDPEGTGGLKQVHEKLDNLERTVGDVKGSMGEDVRLAKEAITRAEACDGKVKEMKRQVEEFDRLLKVSEERLGNVEGVSKTTATAQEALESSVTSKYEVLWEDVLHAIEEMKGGQLKVLQTDLESQREATADKTSSLVNYALSFMASAHMERRNMALNKSLILAWKEQTWNSSRRRLGIAYLHKIVQRRKLVAFDSWSRRHSANQLCERLRDQYEGQLTTVYEKIEDQTGELKRHCSELDNSVASLEDGKSTKESLNASVQNLRDWIEQLKVKDIGQINDTLRDHEQVHERHEELHRGHSDQEIQLDEKIENTKEKVSDLSAKVDDAAKSADVDNMVRDVLMIWNSIKQLDTSKADKKDVDSFALETGNRDKLSVRRLEDLEADLTMRSKQETLRLQEKWTEMEGRLDESGRQFRHWEQMWEKLSGFVEDLVGKIGDLQGAGGKLPPARGGRSNVSSRAEMATMATSGGYDSAATTVSRSGHHSTTGEGFDSKMLWINSAKGIVDSTIDQAVSTPTPTSTRRPRPKSASGARKPLDRAR